MQHSLVLGDDDKYAEELRRLCSSHLELKQEWTTDVLSCSRHLVLRAFLFNPFIALPVLQWVTLDYLQLGAEEEEDPSSDFAKKKLTQVHTLHHNLGSGHHLQVPKTCFVLPTLPHEPKSLQHSPSSLSSICSSQLCGRCSWRGEGCG